MLATEIINNFLSLLNLPFGSDADSDSNTNNVSIEILKNEENFLSINVSLNLKTNNIWKIIWYDWKNIEAIQRVLWVILNNKTNKKVSIRLKINDYINIKKIKLYKLADNKVQKVLRLRKDEGLNNLNAYERKIIHSYISKKKINNITTKSKWSWKDRKLYIIYKKNKEYIDKSLDILWNWI